MANNETGTILPVSEIAEAVKRVNPTAAVHTDATQAVGKVPVDLQAMPVDMLSLSAHKFYGPKGCGALFVRRKSRVRLTPLIHGGGHERGLRSGTLNVPGIVGLGKACEIAVEKIEVEASRHAALRNRLWKQLSETIPSVTVNGDPRSGLPHTLNVCFEGVSSESLLMALDDVALSSGSACTSASFEPSHVLRAMGLSEDEALSSVRFSLGRFTTEHEVDYVAGRVGETVAHLRRMVSV